MTSLDPVALIAQLTWQLVVTVVIALAIGALGGLVPVRAPLTAVHSPSNETRELTSWQRAVVGAVAAAAILFVVDVTTPVQLICGSLVAGYAGTAVLAGLESRLVAILALRETAAMKQQIEMLNRDAETLVKQLDSLMATTTSPTAPSIAAELAAIRRRRNWS